LYAGIIAPPVMGCMDVMTRMLAISIAKQHSMTAVVFIPVALI
jgi:hypothetical protein